MNALSRFAINLFVCCAALLLSMQASGEVLINEIMFHPPSTPTDNLAEEWIELLNTGTAAVDVSAWQLSKGVTFTFPPGTFIPGGGYLIVAADTTAFAAAHPGFSGAIVGGWIGKLSNSSEQIQLDDAAGSKVCDVTYADEGDWALRARGDLSFSHRGWQWLSDADGNGRTLELRNPALGIGSGQNWGVSLVDGGTPGAANSIASANIAPLIKDPKHKPDNPKSSDSITISCGLEDEGTNVTATLHWRLDGGTWQTLVMSDTDGDGRVDATILPQANLAIVEWYIEATDGTLSRTWPAPARTSNPGVVPETYGQTVNALLQVDNSFDATATFRSAAENPIYRIILTAAERAELRTLQTTNGQQESEAAFNATFISHDGTGIKTRYLCSIRNRGQGSALGPPNNYHVGFPSEHFWNDRASVAINCRYGYAQVLGQALMARAGIATQDAAIVKIRVNGADLSEPGVTSATVGRMYGRYARLEGRGGDWTEHHFPLDPDGNFYRLDDHEPGTVGVPAGNLGSGEFRYEGTIAEAYSDCFIKETNKDANDYSDLINFTRIVSAPITGGTVAQPAISNVDYPAAVGAVLDLDEFYRFIAADTLIGNSEGGLSSGRADDASLYRGVLDTRFRFIPHDLDTIFDIGDTGSGATRNIFSYDGSNSPGNGVLGLTRLFTHPQLAPRYYAALLDALNTWYNSATIDPIVDQIMTGWVPATDAVTQNRSINDIKAFVTTRRNSVLAAIQQNYSLATTVSGTDTAEGYKRTMDGSATFSGTFNVAKTYSITVNGQLATWSYRTTGTTTAGTWSMVVPIGGGTILHPGLNRVVVQFWDGIDGSGNVLNTLSVDVLYQPTSATYTTVSGNLQAGSLRLTAPATYIPGKPFLVRADVLDGSGNTDRTVWDGTVDLSSSAPGMTLPSIQLYNGTGTVLATAGGGSALPDDTLIALGSQWYYLDDGSDQGNTPASAWRQKDFATETTAPWKSGNAELGFGDGDEATVLAANGSTPWVTYYFRKHFTVADPVPPYTSLRIRMRCDDGAIVYVNGTQAVLTRGMTANMAYNAGCTFNRTTTSSPNENTFETFTIPVGLLVPGDNTIAIEVHNFVTGGADISMNLEMLATYPSTDPGDFTLTGRYTAPGVNFAASKTVTSLTSAPAVTAASGALPTGTTTWSGVVQVTGDVTVPSGGILNIAPGTHVLVDGDATPGSAAGKRIVINGTLNSQGTFAAPVAITATNATDRWGGLVFSGAQPSTLAYTLLNHAGHTTGVGHTGRGPMLRLSSSNLTITDSAIADGPAKAIYSSGTCDLVIQRSLIERMITGPELEDGCSLLLEDSDIHRILPDYRESNASAPDDEDCLYVHNSTGRSVIVRRAVFARCGDDVFDCLAGPIVVEDSILREGWDKGLSLLNNDLTITRTQIIRCDKAIVPKSQAADTRTVNATNVTIVSENHDTSQSPWGYPVAPSNPDPDSPSTGFYTQNKSGQSNAGATLAITAKNCIVQAESPVLVDAPYSAANTVVTYSDLTLLDNSAFAWPGTGNISANPAYTAAASGNYRITSASPCRDAGDPATLDADGSRADMGALPFTTTVAAGTIAWTPAGGPYRVTANATVPASTTLSIAPGTAVYFDQNARLTVNGRILAQGTAGQRITFSHVPDVVLGTDVDPIKNGTQTGSPKWGGIRVYDSMQQENIFRYCDFINAQGTSPLAAENYGSVGFIRSWGWVDHCTWAGTHLRMCYGRNSKMTVTHNVFPDMFLFDGTLGRLENPTDFLASADNSQEPLKVEYPTTDTEIQNPNFSTNGFPIGGYWRVYYNDFNGNEGHNDVFDADSGRWNAAGDFLLDCRYNYFHGLTGDEHVDLGGDAYIASNIFERGNKDFWTSDTGYSNAISSGDKGTGTTIFVVRNVFFDLDHCINCKLNTATVFEHNTVANLHADFHFVGATVTQDVKCAPINFFIPEDGPNPSYGDGAYMGFNIVSNVPRLFSGADTRKVGGNLVNDITTKIEFNNNLLDQVADPIIGPKHPGDILSGTYGPNTAGAPGFVDAPNKNYALRPDSVARGSTPGGFDYGAGIPEWAYILGGPSGTTASTTASFTIGGPGIVAYKWRLDGGAWSAPIQIGTGGVFPRTSGVGMQRQATLDLSGLASGPHTLEVLGQDVAKNWQDADPARTIEGLPQAAPTSRTWTVDGSFVAVRLSEILADSTSIPDTVEVQNISGASVNLAGWSITDDPAVPGKLPLSGTLAAGGFATFTNAVLGIDKDGDTLLLYQGTTLRDSVTFGQQITGKSLGRHPATGAWVLCSYTPGVANTPIPVADFSGVRINEWYASPGVLYDDGWIELRNTAANPAALAGLRLTNNRAGNAGAYVFPALSFIDAGGFVRLAADGIDALGHLAFRLDAEYEVLTLLGTDGATVDTLQFYPQTTDYSMGRDEGGALTFYELPTRGFFNGTADPAYANALAILRGLRITEVMFNAIGGQDYEYLELRNIGAATLNLAGVTFVQGIDFTFGLGTTLGPGQSILVVKNLAKFRARYGNGPLVAGVYSGNLDNSGERLAIQLPPPFDANVMNFEYKDTWYTASDGSGYAIWVDDPSVSAILWADRESWTLTELGGSPGGVLARSDTYSGWSALHGATSTTSDLDLDGVPALVEYSLGMNPASPNGGDGRAGTPAVTLGANGRTALTFLVPQNGSAGQGHGMAEATMTIQASNNLNTWTTIATKTFAGSWTGSGAVTLSTPGSGYQRVTVEDVVPLDGQPGRFLRLQVAWVP